jgi:hypothetical protein
MRQQVFEYLQVPSYPVAAAIDYLFHGDQSYLVKNIL